MCCNLNATTGRPGLQHIGAEQFSESGELGRTKGSLRGLCRCELGRCNCVPGISKVDELLGRHGTRYEATQIGDIRVGTRSWRRPIQDLNELKLIVKIVLEPEDYLFVVAEMIDRFVSSRERQMRRRDSIPVAARLVKPIVQVSFQ